jgi:hypothetical protein
VSGLHALAPVDERRRSLLDVLEQPRSGSGSRVLQLLLLLLLLKLLQLLQLLQLLVLLQLLLIFSVNPPAHQICIKKVWRYFF